jgi:hypothetical protein
MNAALLRKLRQRDKYCMHCGEDREEYLVPHHRRNRGSGGSKLLDRLDNLMLICSYYNGAMESMSVVAEQARTHGHKLSSWDDFDTPVFDACDGQWYELDMNGGKRLADAPDEPLF